MHRLNPYATVKPDFASLASKHKDFAPFVTTTSTGYASIDFQDPGALRALTRVLLKEDWGLEVALRDDRLVPTVANRLDYILHVLDIEPYLKYLDSAPGPSQLRDSESTIRILDIGTGSSAIYPLLIHSLRPNARITGTELNTLSLDHALSILTRNAIPKDKITLLQASSSGPILFPLEHETFDISICNPPFFGSEEEIKDGQESKSLPAHSAATAAGNELITPGGEVKFVSQMITESLVYRGRCSWYTSLIGKYSSLQPLIDLLRSHKVDNYFVKSIKPAKTVRWILSWSYTLIRLPDDITRPENVYSGTSFAKLLPPPNRFVHTPLHPPYSARQLHTAVRAVIHEIRLLPQTSPISIIDDKEMDLTIAPISNTWSRAARRQALRAEPDATTASTFASVESEPIMRVRLSIIPAKPPMEVQNPQVGDWKGASVSLDWLWGSDRSVVEGFWKFVISKAGLVGKQDGVVVFEKSEGAEEDTANGSVTRSSGRAPKSGTGRGGRGRGGRGRRGQGSQWREGARDSGW